VVKLAKALGVTKDTFSECDEVNDAATSDQDAASPQSGQPRNTDG
jgi:hypothetical protein